MTRRQRLHLTADTIGPLQSWRLWASLPPDVVELVAITATGRARVTIDRPTFPPGVCTGCGCTATDACLTPDPFDERSALACSWRDKGRTRCTACPPARRRLPTVVLDPRPLTRRQAADRRARA